ncbi:MAG: hypothetical protein K9M36_01430 [Candidatus Pacebacteria bacterium]|nr:hypothetical protein [Candidatus Paceibacterota bacterium]
MIHILGVTFKTTGKVLHAPKSKLVSAYIKAVKDGEKQAKKILKKI